MDTSMGRSLFIEKRGNFSSNGTMCCAERKKVFEATAGKMGGPSKEGCGNGEARY